MPTVNAVAGVSEDQIGAMTAGNPRRIFQRQGSY